MNLFLLDPFGRSREPSVKCISCKSPRLFTESSSKLFHIGNEIAPGALQVRCIHVFGKPNFLSS